MDFQTKREQRLVKAFLVLKNRDETERFLRDIFSEKEISEFAKRLEAAQMLCDHVPYSDIRKSTGLSSTTIARISKWLKTGRGGYKKILNRLNT